MIFYFCLGLKGYHECPGKFWESRSVEPVEYLRSANDFDDIGPNQDEYITADAYDSKFYSSNQSSSSVSSPDQSRSSSSYDSTWVFDFDHLELQVL